MRRWFAGVLALLAGCASVVPVPDEGDVAAGADRAARDRPMPPSLLYPGLFQAVAMTDLYEPKDWTDARPLGSPDEIMAAWRAAGAPVGEAALAAFTDDWFEPPEKVAVALDLPEGRTLSEHVEMLWPVLTRAQEGEAEGSLLPLPEPYVVPGGRFREVYYWDAYFTMTGMGPEHDALKRDMVDNFAHQIEEYGHVPNANRSYYLSRSQPPFFASMIGLPGPTEPLGHVVYLDAMRAEHAFWSAAERTVTLPTGEALTRYWDARDAPRDESYRYDVATAEETGRPAAEVYRHLRAGAESGWDYSSRWFADGRTLGTIEAADVVPVDLNSLLVNLGYQIETGCVMAAVPASLTDPDATACKGAPDEFRAAQLRHRTIRDRMWSEDLGAFVDLNLDGTQRERITAATVYPLFFGIATQEQSDRVAETVRTHLLAPGGLVTTTVTTGEQWDAPNGWAPLQWLAVIGLERYGHDDLAFEIARRWTSTVARGFCESGKLVEKYDVVTAQPGGGGEYPTQDGFGWTNGVTMALIRRDARLAGLADVPEMTDAPGGCGAAVTEALR